MVRKKRKQKIKTYVLYNWATQKWHEVKAKNYIQASKMMHVTPYTLRTYGHIKLSDVV